MSRLLVCQNLLMREGDRRFEKKEKRHIRPADSKR
jgi:hypothetical protein